MNDYGFTAKQLDRSLEKANAYSHGVGIVIGLIAAPFIICLAASKGDSYFYSAWIYLLSFFMVFVSSTWYHAAINLRIKHKLRIADHISIYFLIAGTYTPMLMSFASDPVRNRLLIFLWGTTFLGSIFKLIFGTKYDFISAILYVLMGWSVVFVTDNGLDEIPEISYILFVTGGIIYSLGVVFYLWNSMYKNHLIWHFFVLIAGLCHLLAVFYMVK